MTLSLSTSESEAQKPAAAITASPRQHNPMRVRLTAFLDHSIFALLIVFAITVPHSIKGAERSWKAALVLWLIKLAIEHLRPYRQPLAAPLLAYVSLSAISTLLSPDPYLSWDRMKFVCLFLVGVVVAQNLKRLSQVRWLAMLLVFSGLASAAYTGWEYTYGVGVRLVEFQTPSRLTEVGLQRGDIVTSFDGHKTYTPEQLLHSLRQAPPTAKVPVEYLRERALRTAAISASAEDFLQSGIGTDAARLSRGKPIRAQGTLGHYVVFAEMLMQIACMAWALVLACGRGATVWRLLLVLAFVGITAALFATQTRAALGGLVLGCLVTLLLLTKGKLRATLVVAVIVILAAATLWIQHTRKTEWAGRQDAGTHFRVLMWEDGIRLIREHPWFGVGMETARVHFREWNIRGFIQYNVQSHFHSTYLQIAVERGIPALAAWIWFCVAYIVFLLRLVPKLQAKSRFAGGVAAGVLAGFVAFCFTSFFHYNLGEESLALILFFFFGIAMAMDRMLATPDALDVA